MIKTQITSLIKSFFAQLFPHRVLTGKPTYRFLANKVVVQIPYFMPLFSFPNNFPALPNFVGKKLGTGEQEGEKACTGTLTDPQVNALGLAITQVLSVKTKFPALLGKGNVGTKTVVFTRVGRPVNSVRIGNTHNLELRLVRLRYPYLDSSILAQYLALNAGKYNFTRMQKMIFSSLVLAPSQSLIEKQELRSNDKVVTIKPSIESNASSLSLLGKRGEATLPSQLTGVKLELAGRLTTQRSIPRKTVENGHTGSFGLSSLDFSQYASKNKIGAFTIKV